MNASCKYFPHDDLSSCVIVNWWFHQAKLVFLELDVRDVQTAHILEGYPRTPDSSEGLIPRATICYRGIDP